MLTFTYIGSASIVCAVESRWNGNGGNNNWSTLGNWNNGVPGPGDTARFDGSTPPSPNKPCVIDIAVTIQMLMVDSAFTGSITANNDIVVTTNFQLSSGTFNLGSNDLTIGDQLNIETNATFNMGISTVTMKAQSGPHNIKTSGNSIYNLVISSNVNNASYILMSNLDITNNFTIEHGTFSTNNLMDYTVNVGSSVYLNGGTFEANGSTITVGASWSAPDGGGTFNYGTSSVTLSGSGILDAYYINSKFHNLSFAASGEQIVLSASIMEVKNNISFNGGEVTDGSESNDIWVSDIDDPDSIYIHPGTIMNFSVLALYAATDTVNLPSYSGYKTLDLHTDVSVNTTYYVQAGGIAGTNINVYGGNGPSTEGFLNLNGQSLVTSNSFRLGYTNPTSGRGNLITNGGNVNIGSLSLYKGVFNAGSSHIDVTFNWTKYPEGEFVSGTSTVTFLNAITSTIKGSNTFYNLISTDTSKPSVKFASNTVTYVVNHLELANTNLRSTLDNNTWYLKLSGTQDVHDVNVMDSNASGGNMIDASNSVNAGNNSNWDFGPTVYTWTGLGDGVAWNNPGNWDIGSGYPDNANEKAVIDNTGNSITTSGPLTIGELELKGGFNGTLSLNGDLTIDNSGSHSGNLNLITGTFFTNGNDITISSSVLINGGTFYANTSSITVGASWSMISGAFNYGISSVTFAANGGSHNILTSGASFYNLIISTDTNSASYVLNDPLYVINDFTLLSGVFTTNAAFDYEMYVGSNVYINDGTFNANASTITVGNDWVVMSAAFFSSSQSTVEMIGNGSITTQSSNFYNLRLAKPGMTITMNNTFNVMGFIEFEGGTVTGSYTLGLYTNVTDPLIIAPGTV
ncbi:MAG: hypothetical protein ABII23_00675, partial [bacterium]